MPNPEKTEPDTVGLMCLVSGPDRFNVVSATKGVESGVSTVYFTIIIRETTTTMYLHNHSQKISNVCGTSLWLSSLLSAWLQFLMGFFSLWTRFSFFDSLDRVCRDWLTLFESEYCPTSLPTRTPEGIRYKSASPGPKSEAQVLYQAREQYTKRNLILCRLINKSY